MEKRGFYDLCDIIEKLRAPGGCPWDREQTHASLKKHLIEEAYEAAEAIDSGIGGKMADELGDVLLQVVLHAQIGKEAGEFTVDDVTEAVCAKMISRHPHIFGSVKADTSQEVLNNWEEIKQKERGQATASSALEGVSRALPALTRGEKLYKKAKKAGYAEIPGDNEPGRALFAEMARLTDMGLNPEEELRNYLEKYIKNFKIFEENT